MPDTQPTAAAMEAARKVFADCAAAFNHEPLTADGPDPVKIECVAAALDAYAAEQCLIRHAGRAILAETERDAALAKLEAAKAEANRVARLADSECDRREAAEERVRALERVLREVRALDNARRPGAITMLIDVALNTKAAAAEGGKG